MPTVNGLALIPKCPRHGEEPHQRPWDYLIECYKHTVERSRGFFFSFSFSIMHTAAGFIPCNNISSCGKTRRCCQNVNPCAQKHLPKYKADTDLVAEWLAITAKTNGYEVAAATPIATGGRLKGKARKLAKAGAAKTSQTTTTASSSSLRNSTPAPKSTHLIKIKDFETLAAFISKINSLKIPKYFVVALDRVIIGQSLIL